MNALVSPFRQLMERKLWPLAILLVAALAAVPMLLARDAETPPPAPAASATQAQTAAAVAAKPIVTVGDDAARETRRKVLGAAKDPFKPQVAAKKPKSTTTTAKSASASGGDSSTGGSTVTTGSGPVPFPGFSSPVTPAAPKKVYEMYSLTIKWGDSASGDLDRRRVNRLKALPSTEEPAVIYLGLLDDKKTAVFLVDHDATIQGDGKCLPSPDDCQTLQMRVNDIAFIDVVGGEQYQLELVSIKRGRTTDASALKSEAKGGRAALRARMGRVGRLRYDASSGTLKRLSAKAHKAEMAKASAR